MPYMDTLKYYDGEYLYNYKDMGFTVVELNSRDGNVDNISELN
jgi:hypothetical protein